MVLVNLLTSSVYGTFVISATLKKSQEPAGYPDIRD